MKSILRRLRRFYLNAFNKLTNYNATKQTKLKKNKLYFRQCLLEFVENFILNEKELLFLEHESKNELVLVVGSMFYPKDLDNISSSSVDANFSSSFHRIFSAFGFRRFLLLSRNKSFKLLLMKFRIWQLHLKDSGKCFWSEDLQIGYDFIERIVE